MSGDRRTFDWDDEPRVVWPGDPEDRSGAWFGGIDPDEPFIPFRYDADLLNRHYGVGETW